MSVRIKAHELAKEIKESKEWQRFESAKKEIEQHEAAKLMLRDFNAKQLELYQKELMGEKPSEEDLAVLQRLAETVSFNPYVREFLEAEYEFTQMMAEVQNIINDALGIKVPEPGSDDNAQKPQSSRLWTPS